MPSKNNKIRQEGAESYLDNTCPYKDIHRTSLWWEGWNQEKKEQEDLANEQEKEIIWIDPRDNLIGSIDQIQSALQQLNIDKDLL